MTSPIRLGLAMMLGCLLQACTKPPAVVLRVGINAWPGYEFLYLAQQKNFYHQEGVNVRLIEFASLSDCRRAYERGQIDVMGTTVIEVLQVYDQSERTPQIVQIIDYSDGADEILTQSTLATGTDLRGKRVGVELASLGIYVLARGLEKNGLNLSDVTTVNMDQISLVEAFSKGELDAIVTYPPFSIKLRHQTAAHSLFSTASISGEVLDVIAVESSLARSHPAAIAGLLRAYHRAHDYARTDPATAHRIMAEREGVTPEEFAAALSDGVKLVDQASQASYLQPGGKLSLVLDKADRILRQSGQLTGADHRAQIPTADFLRP